jgi:SAM-dependent methyltransferase
MQRRVVCSALFAVKRQRSTEESVLNRPTTRPRIVAGTAATPKQLATDPGQYDRQDFTWEPEGRDARILQYWGYLKKCARYWDKRRVLDVGCGDGWFLNNMLRSGAQTALGIEPSEHGRLLARAKFPKLLVQPHSWEDYPTDPDSFDLITAIMSLCHISDVNSFFGKAWQTLSEGGNIIAVVPDFDYWGKPRRQYEIKVEQIDSDSYAAAITRQSGTIADVVRRPSLYGTAAEKAGFSLVETMPMPPVADFLKLAPGYADVEKMPITQLLVFQKQ